MEPEVTTEVRWFTDGPLPGEVLSWFTGDGAAGLTEQRTDTYRLDDRVDVGVKRRFGQTLELKTRREGQQLLDLDANLVGVVETWQRWSPADGRVERRDGEAWLDVHKMIVKRRFDATGHEIPLTEANRAMTGSACDVEVAAVEVDGRPAWSLALAAFGPAVSWRTSILAAWASLRRGRPWAIRSGTLGESYGYPEWVARACPVPLAEVRSAARQPMAAASLVET